MKKKMSVKELQKKFDEAPFIEQAALTFTACIRRVCESNVQADIKGDAMAIAVKFFMAATRTDLCEKALEVKKQNLSVDNILMVWGLESLQEMNGQQDRLKNIMELFTGEGSEKIRRRTRNGLD